MRFRSFALVAGMLLLCAPSGAQEIRPTFETQLIWNDNVFGTESAEVDDTAFRTTAGIEVIQPRGDVSWTLSYEPSYEYSLDESGLRGWDHDASVAFAWRITPRWTLRISEDFERYRSIARLNQLATDSAGVTTVEFVGSRRRFIRNTAVAALSYQPDARNRTTASAQFLNWDFSDRGRADVEILLASLSHIYTFDKRTRLTAGASWRERTNEQTDLGAESKSTFYNLNLEVEHHIDPTLVLTVAGGPAFITADQTLPVPRQFAEQFPLFQAPTGDQFLVDFATCPTLDDGTRYLSLACERLGGPVNAFPNPVIFLPLVGTVPEPDTSTFSYFANLRIVKNWEQWRLVLDFVRRADDSSSVGSASIENNGSVRVVYQANPRFTLSATAAYSVREQEVEFTSFLTTLTGAGPIAQRVDIRPTLIDRADERTSLRFSMRARWRYSERLAITASGYWYDEDDERGGVLIRDAQRLTFYLGFEYAFEPIHL